MRTNIEIDDTLMKEALKASGAKTKRAAVEAALQMMVRRHRQTRIRRLIGKVAVDEEYLKEVRSRFDQSDVA